jgi:hypothetical protein
VFPDALSVITPFSGEILASVRGFGCKTECDAGCSLTAERHSHQPTMGSTRRLCRQHHRAHAPVGMTAAAEFARKPGRR